MAQPAMRGWRAAQHTDNDAANHVALTAMAVLSG